MRLTLLGRPRLFLLTTIVSFPYLSFRLLLIRSHICFSDNFCFVPFIRRDFVHSGRLLHSFSTNLRFPPIIRFPPIFVFHQSSRSTNLRLRIFHTLVPHKFVYPELFFVPMSISTAEQIPTQSTIPQLVTHIIRQTERCSSPCFFYGSEHH